MGVAQPGAECFAGWRTILPDLAVVFVPCAMQGMKEGSRTSSTWSGGLHGENEMSSGLHTPRALSIAGDGRQRRMCAPQSLPGSEVRALREHAADVHSVRCAVLPCSRPVDPLAATTTEAA